MMKNKFIPVMSLLFSLTAAPTHAKEPNLEIPLVPKLIGTEVSFPVSIGPKQASLSISGPNGFQATKFTENRTPTIDLYQAGKLADGMYNYEITIPVGERVLIQDRINNGRGENNSHYARKGVKKSGHFWIKNGQIQNFQKVKEPSIIELRR